MEGAAREAFWILLIGTFKRLASAQYKLNLFSSDVDILFGLIMKVINCTELELAQILEKRCIAISSVRIAECMFLNHVCIVHSVVHSL